MNQCKEMDDASGVKCPLCRIKNKPVHLCFVFTSFKMSKFIVFEAIYVY